MSQLPPDDADLADDGSALDMERSTTVGEGRGEPRDDAQAVGDGDPGDEERVTEDIQDAFNPG